MVEDNRRFRSSAELANAMFGSAFPTEAERKLREEQHKAAQVPKVEEPEVRPEGWLPPGVMTTNTDALAFRNGFRMPEEKDIAAGIAKAMAQVVGHARGIKGG
jgi:hypothetical protein